MIDCAEDPQPAPIRLALTSLCVALLLAACGGGEVATMPEQVASAAEAQEIEADDAGIVDADDPPAAESKWSTPLEKRLSGPENGFAAAPPNGGPKAFIKGAFGPVFNWPGMPIHLVLLPDSRVLAYGSDFKGVRKTLKYAVWDPAAGTTLDAFQILDNVTQTNIFCATQLLSPSTGEVMVLGGTRKDEWYRGGYGSSDVTWFSPSANTLRKDSQSMASRRWYATAITTANGAQVVMGGRDIADYSTGPHPPTTATYAPTPEVYSSSLGWRELSAASSQEAYGEDEGAWWYPPAWLAPNGHVFVLNRMGFMYDLDQSGQGHLTKYNTKTSWSNRTPSLMFAPGKILSLRSRGAAVVVDINGSEPKLTETSPLSQAREYGNATLLADGKVFVNGGSSSGNKLDGAAYHSEIWDPETGAWAMGAVAKKARLYHSTAMLLPDGSVLTGGGGSPGPVTNLNAEIYYPPYFFRKDGSGELGWRPRILSAPSRQLTWSEPFTLQVHHDVVVKEVRMTRTGSVTHAFNNEQRSMTLPFTQVGSTLQLKMPAGRAVAPPGFYMLFVVAPNGVPSVARIVKLNS